jgi:hypothetical protein
MGPVLIHNLRALLSKTPLKTYEPQSGFLALLMTGDGRAVGTKWGIAFQGGWVFSMKTWIDCTWMDLFDPAKLRDGGPLDFRPVHPDATEPIIAALTTAQACAALRKRGTACLKFGTQWAAIVRMSRDAAFCAAVVKQFKAEV